MKMCLVFAFSLFMSLTSCVTILQSLVTPDTIITDNRIEGTWFDSDSKNIFVQKLMESKLKEALKEATGADRGTLNQQDSIFYSKLYVISYRENNLDYTWIAGIVNIKGQYYLNLLPEDCLDSNGNKTYDLGEVTSSIAKLEWKNNNSLVLSFLNGDYIKEIALAGKVRIKYEYDPLFGTFVITASSRELEHFLEKYGDNESLFKGGNTIILTSKT